LAQVWPVCCFLNLAGAVGIFVEMSSRWWVPLLVLLLGDLRIAGADKSVQAEDATLPAVNFKYEFSSRSTEAGGETAQDVLDLIAFKKRARHVLDGISKDSEVSVAFVAAAHAQLDDLMSIFQKLLHGKTASSLRRS